jgi:hypothetical protein
MKGIVFNLLEEAVAAKYGEATWEALLSTAKVSGAYTSLGNYPDEELGSLVTAASEALKVPPDAVVRWFGNACIPLFHARYPQLFSSHRDAKSMVLALNDIIHPEVRKLYPGADVPDFDFEDRGPNSLALGYRSKRKLCAFAEGLIQGTAAHFAQTVRLQQTRCMLLGDPKCLIVCEFSPAGRPRVA